jgi:uncharacterized protein (DUF305 family)
VAVALTLGYGGAALGAGCAAAALALVSAGSVRAQEIAQPLYNAADLAFLQHMIVHHEQALTMCEWVPGRTKREEFVHFARYVERAQAAEIAEMKSLLAIAAERGLAIPEQHLHGDPPMAGMLSTAQMQTIEAATGTEFERLWLQGMIVHHDGAVDMARAQQQQQLDTRRQPYELATLVEDILIEQRAEIAKMRGWLQDWGLER